MNTLLKTLFFLLLVTQICLAQWVQTNGPYGGYVWACAVSDTNIYASTQAGIFRSTINGTDWTLINSELTMVDFVLAPNRSGGTNIFGLGGNHFFSAGAFLSTDNGTNWSPINLGLPNNFQPVISCLAVSPDGANLFAGTGFYGTGGGVYRSTDNGTSWIPADSGLTEAAVYSLVAIPDGMGGTKLLVSTANGIFLSTNNGTYWTLVNTNTYDGFVFSPNSSGGMNIFATGAYGGSSSGVFLSTDYGTNWSIINTGLPTNTRFTCLAISPDGANLFLGTEDAGIFRSTNNGASWIDASSGLPKVYINDITISPDGLNIFAGLAWSGVFRSLDNGSSWIEANTGLIDVSVNAFAVNSQKLFAGTSNGVFLSVDEGTNWAAVKSGLPPYKNITTLFFDSNNLFAGVQGEGIYFFSNNGTNWSKANASINIGSSVLSFTSTGTTLFAGTGEGVLRSIDNGINWTEVAFTNTYVSDFIIIGANIFASTGGGVFLSTDNGESWVAKNNGLPKYEDGNYYLRDFALSGENLFVGGEKGVFRSTDYGGSWAAVNSGLPLNTDVCAFAVIGENIFIGTRTVANTNVIAGVFLSTNNGASWNDVSSGLPQTGNKFISALVISGSNLFAGANGAGGLGVWCRPLSELVTMVPVELTSFTATANRKEVILNWSTATELNNQGFEIQRKFGSNNFVTIGSVKGHGTTTSPNQYTFVDKLLDPGKYFYRLKQIDYGGKYEYSQTLEVNWSPFTSYKLEQNYPNPFNPTTTIGFGIPEKGNIRLSILNILGEEIIVLLNEEKEAGYHSVDFNASDLPSGVYFYQLNAGSFVETRKMILLR